MVPKGSTAYGPDLTRVGTNSKSRKFLIAIELEDSKSSRKLSEYHISNFELPELNELELVKKAQLRSITKLNRTSRE